MRIAAIIVGGGEGKRMGRIRDKLFLSLDGVPLLARTLQAFQNHPRIEEMAVVISEKLEARFKKEIEDRYQFSKIVAVTTGGERRQDSVYKGLRALAPAPDIVLIHDADRPFVNAGIIDRVIEGVTTAGAALAAVRPRDTVKEVDENEMVTGTIDRSHLRLAQTPQGFRYREIRAAHDHARKEDWAVTDDASLIERRGGRVLTVAGSYENIKVTFPEDIGLARGIVREKQWGIN